MDCELWEERGDIIKSVTLAEITTRDGLMHQGFWFRPTNPTRTAILWIHGLSSVFYSNLRLFEAFFDECEEAGIGFASFNTRGHDVITGIRKVDKRKAKGYRHVNGGVAYESFADSVHDIDAGITFLAKYGFTHVVIVGHSTGANKACYYGGSKRDPRLAGVVLAGPVSDRLDPALDQVELANDIRYMKSLIETGKGDEVISGYHIFPMTPKRFVSLLDKQSLEDQFDYGEEKPKLPYFTKIRKPLLVVLSQKDEYIDRPIEILKHTYNTYARSEQYESIILPNALHSFNRTEKETAKVITRWCKRIAT